MIDVEPQTIVLYSDIGCPWAHASVHRLLATRDRLGLADQIAVDHRAFCLEVVNRRPTPKRILDAEIPVAGALAPEAGWQMWQPDPSRYPVTTLLALEAVQAAKEQGLAASERLDGGLRRAFFGESQCISLRHVVLEVAGKVDLDVDALQEALDSGRARKAVLDQHAAAEPSGVQGSPHLFLSDGTDVHNPGVDIHWEGEKGKGFPVVTSDDPSVYEDLLQRAAKTSA